MSDLSKRPRRAEAWVYGVINPLSEALATEIGFLERGNVTWRFHTGRLEFIGSPSSYLDPNGRAILDDLARSRPEVRPWLADHEPLIKELERLATACLDDLMSDPTFRDAVQHEIDGYLASGHPDPWGAWTRADMPKLVAERLINAINEVSPHHSDAAFWRAAVPKLGAFASRGSFDELARARSAVAKDAERLVDRFGKLRSELCESHDIPAAPLPDYAVGAR